jgi:hypothetical protein
MAKNEKILTAGIPWKRDHIVETERKQFLKNFLLWKTRAIETPFNFTFIVPTLAHIMTDTATKNGASARMEKRANGDRLTITAIETVANKAIAAARSHVDGLTAQDQKELAAALADRADKLKGLHEKAVAGDAEALAALFSAE